MKRTIFYSWQSDLQNATNRGFIQTALENVARAISKDDSVDIEPVIDRDTQGVAGTPDIASTIFAKIGNADIMVADVSIVSRPKNGRATPNPNVLIELGYAFKALGSERIILVYNTAHGKIEELPFDLRARRVIAFNVPDGAKEKSAERKDLEVKLSSAVTEALKQLHEQVREPESADRVVEAIENNQKNKKALLLKYLKELLVLLDKHQPKLPRNGGTVKDLMGAVDLTRDAMAGFTRVVHAIAVNADTELSQDVYQWFGQLYERYDLPRGFSGTSHNTDFDYFKFVGYEAFVTLIGVFIKFKQWKIVEGLLDEPIDVPYVFQKNSPDSIDWYQISAHVGLLDRENARRNKELGSNRYSLHADILKERHENGVLATLMPLDDFMAADYFLYLYIALKQEDDRNIYEWCPWIAAAYIDQVPPFIIAAKRKTVASQLAKIFGVPSVEVLKERLAERGDALKRLYDKSYGTSPKTPLRESDIQEIGSIQ